MTVADPTADTTPPGPRLALSIIVILIGTAMGITGLVIAITKVVHEFTGTVFTSPNPITRSFGSGTYEVFIAETDSGLTPLVSPSDVEVTSSAGQTVVPFDRSSHSSESIGKGGDEYNGVIEFTITTPGVYTVTLHNHDGENYFVSRTFGDLAKRAAGWFALMGTGMLVGFVGVVMLIVGIVRRRRLRRPAAMYAGAYGGTYPPGGVVPPGWQPAPQPAAPQPPQPAASLPVAGWYPDPQLPGTQRWWDGTRWTDQTQQQS
jgi:Protein of unknown function (DUF2510)